MITFIEAEDVIHALAFDLGLQSRLHISRS